MFLPYTIEYDYREPPYAIGALVFANLCGFVVIAGLSDSALMQLLLWPDAFAPWQWWTSGFLHAGIMHFAGNMLFLWVYGRYLEERLGPVRFIALYFALLAIASLVYIVANLGNDVPALGASGAISGLMGVVMATSSSARVKTLIWWGPIIRVVPVAAGLILALWVIEQSAMAMMGAPGIAVSAHLGGFGGGFLIGWILKKDNLKDSGWHLANDSQTREDLDMRLKNECYSYLGDYHRSARNGRLGNNEIPDWTKTPEREDEVKDPYWEEQIRLWNKDESKSK